jgi:multiple sugar transport system ATP-binding protein
VVGIRLAGLSKRFGDVQAVHPLDLEVERGELLVLLGPSGCGKSTVLRMIAGLEEPTAGSVWIGERQVDDLEPARRDVAMVFQSYALYPHMTVRQNLSFGLRMRKADPAEVERKVGWAAEMLGLDALLDRRPGQLSGGQRQRVALGRAMVREPAAFLFDEPLSNLDARLRSEMRDEIARLHRRLDATMVFVTHDQVEAMSLGQRIAVLRDGALQQCGTPMEIYREPANLFVARFVGSPAINSVDGVLGDDGGGALFMAGELTLAGGPEIRPAEHGGVPAVLGVRPEALEVTEGDDPAAHFRTAVRRTEPLGSEVLVHVEGPDGGAWVVRAGPDAHPRAGDAVGVRIDADKAHVFDASTHTRLGTLGRRDG